MVEISNEEFENLITASLLRIPEKFRKLLSNIVVVWEEEPSVQQLYKLNMSPEQSLFGLYEGVPQTVRGVGYSALPDKITIFKKPIVNSCFNFEEVKNKVAETVWHELAHHFGSSEERVRKAQSKRRR